MGRAVADAFPSARRVFERADTALGEPLSTLCFEGPIEKLTETANTQPALVATSAAILAAIREAHPSLPPPAFAAGHSLGEYSALAAAGALELEDAIELCRIRGRAMQQAVPIGLGAMAALMGPTPEAVREICDEAAEGEVVSPANFNAHGQTVIAGHAAAVARASKLAADKGARAIPLKVSAPFHCALMRPALEPMRSALERTTMGAFAFPVVANVDAEPHTDAAEAKDLLLRQIEAPVQWVRTIERLRDEGVTVALEIGPGKVLAGLIKRIAKEIRVIGVADPDGISRLRELGLS
jgi:[acyl-carrier-protein] S-malonyltransferase